MTWVLGKPFHLDKTTYSLLIADTCVTYVVKDGTKQYKDCLLKIHDISRENGLLLGFAGNVAHAFSIIEDMRIVAADMSLKSPDRKFDILDFILEWQKYTKLYDKHLYEDNENEGVHMIIAGNHTENNSTGNKYLPCAAYKIASPGYRPMSIHPFQWHNIGSGADMETCKKIINQLSEDFTLRIIANDSTTKEFVNFIAPKISAALEQWGVEPGVGNQLIIGISTVGDTGIAATFRVDKHAHPTKHLATSYEELVELLNTGSAKATYLA
jgi:hypothetical protein